MRFPEFSLSLPVWIEDSIPGPDHVYATAEDRMRLVIKLSRLNIEHKNGGPFGAAIFDLETRRLVSVGVNMVISRSCSVVHAEVVAIMIAHEALKQYDLGCAGMPVYEMVASTEPCVMCIGAVIWSGVRSLLCGARDADAREIGFDEGPKPPDWKKSLESRGIDVKQDICRTEAATVLRQYYKDGGIIYNARQV